MRQNVLDIHVIGCNALKLTNSRKTVSNANCMTTLHATAYKHRTTQIVLHSVSTELFTFAGGGELRSPGEVAAWLSIIDANFVK